ncbi:MAG: hypothetical protein A2Z11_00675 [Candidatus Woykebacteria bacterium RBG_16_43_9]|uniref:SprT-like domain-containing protein n=1 Tax=Candidatus Woykebacteria bacterium RBG_16_43_9 TaxID=1802596 RepID=A0A1G1WCZ5_9BACT|nr:MAG: hypothetical protein A2Z11_00675 [Candidatus Woykebacteria bacterium RBG_16_43_9]
MREKSDLKKRLGFLWRNYFSDVAEKYPVDIKFGRRARYRFGSIRFCYPTKSVRILINGRFRAKKYPQEIIDHTIAHEMVHYSQGFPSPGPRLHRYPHRGGIVDKELKERHLIHLVIFYHSWVKNYIKSL